MGLRWREKARHPEVFESDINIILSRLASAPTTGFRAKMTKRRIVYRMGTEKTKLHVYYLVDAEKSVVTVLHLWSQLRGSAPRL